MAIAQIQSWLNNNSDYNEGQKLYNVYGQNLALKKLFQRGKNVYSVKKLRKELIFIDSSTTKIVYEEIKPKKIKAKLARLKINQYPKELHAAFEKQNELYSFLNYYHPQLHKIKRPKRDKICLGIVNAAEEIDSIYRLLDYWKENRIVLDNKYQEKENVVITDKLELSKQIQRYRVQISKQKNNPKRQVDVVFWKKEIHKLTALIESYVV